MNCPKCNNPVSAVLDTRPGKNFIRRRRKCSDPKCSWRWSTYEFNDNEVTPRIIQFIKAHEPVQTYIDNMFNHANELSEAAKTLKYILKGLGKGGHEEQSEESEEPQGIAEAQA